MGIAPHFPLPFAHSGSGSYNSHPDLLMIPHFSPISPISPIFPWPPRDLGISGFGYFLGLPRSLHSCPQSVPAGRSAGSIRYTPHPMCLLQKQNPPMWIACTKFPPTPPFRTPHPLPPPSTFFGSLRSTRGQPLQPPEITRLLRLCTFQKVSVRH